MGYQTGTSTGPNDLIDKLRLFLIAEGWTVNLFTAVGAGYRLHVQKSPMTGEADMYFNFRSAIDEHGPTLITEDNYNADGGDVTGLCINGSTGYNISEDWDTQPGHCENGSGESYGCCITPMSISAIPAYYFFTVGNTINIVVEITAGKFQFMSFGLLEKQGLYTGGHFFTGSMSSRYPEFDYSGSSYVYDAPKYLAPSGPYSADAVHGAVYVNVDGVASWRRESYSAKDTATMNLYVAFTCPSGQKLNLAGSNSSCRGIASMFWSKGPNFYNNIAALCPAYVFIKRSDKNYSLLGWPAGVRSLNYQNYSSGQEVTYGVETWKIFPADKGVNFEPENTNCGFAFLKEL